MIRLLIADDQSMIRSGFRMILEAEDDMQVVAEAGDGAEAVEQTRSHGPDVVLMDIRMPKMDGIEATKLVVEMGAKVLILTTFDLDEYLFSSIRAGASGFMLKDAPAQDLIDAVRIVAGGEALIEPRMTKRLLAEFARVPEPAPAAKLPTGFEELTAREAEVFRAVASGLSNQEIAESLFISETTVKTHVARMLMKLGLRDRIQAVVLAYEHGLTGEESHG